MRCQSPLEPRHTHCTECASTPLLFSTHTHITACVDIVMQMTTCVALILLRSPRSERRMRCEGRRAAAHVPSGRYGTYIRVTFASHSNLGHYPQERKLENAERSRREHSATHFVVHRPPPRLLFSQIRRLSVSGPAHTRRRPQRTTHTHRHSVSVLHKALTKIPPEERCKRATAVGVDKKHKKRSLPRTNKSSSPSLHIHIHNCAHDAATQRLVDDKRVGRPSATNECKRDERRRARN